MKPEFWTAEQHQRAGELLLELAKLLKVPDRIGLQVAQTLCATATAIKLATEKGTTEAIIVTIFEGRLVSWQKTTDGAWSKVEDVLDRDNPVSESHQNFL